MRDNRDQAWADAGLVDTNTQYITQCVANTAVASSYAAAVVSAITAIKGTVNQAAENMGEHVDGVIDPANTCFTEGTQIVIGMGYDENGVVIYDTKNIEDIQIGDLVYSYNTLTGEIEQTEVTATFARRNNHLNYLTILDAKGNEQVIEVTDAHPFWVVSDAPDLSRAARSLAYENGVTIYHGDVSPGLNGYWVEAKDLQIGDVFLGADGTLSTLANTVRIDQEGGIAVFNFTVEGNHNYFILAKEYGYGQTCVLVHNKMGYRAVSQPEFDDILDKGLFRQHPDGLSFEGKWFATTEKGATAFGEDFAKRNWDAKNFQIIKADIPDNAIGQFREKMDGIADAFFVDPENLPLIKPLIQ